MQNIMSKVLRTKNTNYGSIKNTCILFQYESQIGMVQLISKAT